MKYFFTLNDRIYLELAIQAERGGEDDVQELRGELFDKLKISDQERTEFLRAVPGGVLIDKTAPELEADLDKHDVRKLKALLLAWKKQFGSVNDREALASLLTTLETKQATGIHAVP